VILMVTAKNTIPKFLKSKILRDDGCPTCGSMDFGIIEVRKLHISVRRKIKCYNCKKFWFDN